MTKKTRPRWCGRGPQVRFNRQIEHCNGRSESCAESESDSNSKSESCAESESGCNGKSESGCNGKSESGCRSENVNYLSEDDEGHDADEQVILSGYLRDLDSHNIFVPEKCVHYCTMHYAGRQSPSF